jgi:integrase
MHTTNNKVLTPAELKALITAGLTHHSAALAALLIGALAGVRTKEMAPTSQTRDRLRWGHFSLESQEPNFSVGNDISNSGRRTIPLESPLMAWARLLRGPADQAIYTGNDLTAAIRKIATYAGIDLQAHDLHRSFITYRAATDSLDQAVLETGRGTMIHPQTSTWFFNASKHTATAWFYQDPLRYGDLVGSYLEGRRH